MSFSCDQWPPRTAFKGVSELPPGHVLVADAVEGGGVRISVRPYWQLSYPSRGDFGDLAGRSEASVAEELRELLIDSTRLRLRADVPVGAYLSGGLDSSITTALIKLFTNSKLRTFSVGFETDEFDEGRYQQQVVKALNTEHESVICTKADIGRMMKNCANTNTDDTAIPYAVKRAAPSRLISPPFSTR